MNTQVKLIVKTWQTTKFWNLSLFWVQDLAYQRNDCIFHDLVFQDMNTSESDCQHLTDQVPKSNMFLLWSLDNGCTTQALNLSFLKQTCSKVLQYFNTSPVDTASVSKFQHVTHMCLHILRICLENTWGCLENTCYVWKT